MVGFLNEIFLLTVTKNSTAMFNQSNLPPLFVAFREMLETNLGKALPNETFYIAEDSIIISQVIIQFHEYTEKDSFFTRIAHEPSSNCS